MARAKRGKKAIAPAAPVDPARAAIEEAIRKDPLDPAPYLVLADLLQTNGDPRGELISVQEALAGVPTDRLRALEEDLLERYQEALLGPLHVALEELGPLPGRQMIGLEWRRGFLRSVTMSVRDRGPQLAGIVRALGGSPAAAFLERFEAMVRIGDDELDELVEAIAEAMPPTLRELAITTMYGDLDGDDLWPHLPELRSIRLAAREGRCQLGAVRTAALEHLDVNSLAAEHAEELIARPLPALRHLALELTRAEAGSCLTLLDGALPQLHHLGLVRYPAVDLARMKLGEITSLRLAPASSQTVRAVIAAGAKLRSLDLGFQDLEAASEIAPILEGALPELVHLGLGPTNHTMHDLAMLARSKLLPRLQTLTLRDFPSYQAGELARPNKKLAAIPRIEIYCANLERSYRADELAAATKRLPNLRLVRQTV